MKIGFYYSVIHIEIVTILLILINILLIKTFFLVRPIWQSFLCYFRKSSTIMKYHNFRHYSSKNKPINISLESLSHIIFDDMLGSEPKKVICILNQAQYNHLCSRAIMYF